ncbi:hypothetical protein FH972_024712 [Carpinus fangiana]|uniref:RRM domain-containing protein n=1 Tax=Carpinus fangiana TaxID=176857 RepID=A0A5N6KZ48_9ROSI|nr:hypothetical protein FH972_024712 [Carpinus fangiana]
MPQMQVKSRQDRVTKIARDREVDLQPLPTQIQSCSIPRLHAGALASVIATPGERHSRARHHGHRRGGNAQQHIPELVETLTEIFSEYGTILDIVAKTSLKRKGQAFIVFSEHDAAEKAIEEIQGFEVFDKPMQLAFAKTRSDATVKQDAGEDSQEFEQHKKHRIAEKERKQAQQAQEQKLKRPAAGAPAAQPPPSKLSKGAGLKSTGGAVGVVPDEYLPPNRTLFVQNLPDDIDIDTLTQLFQQFEDFKEVRLVPSRKGLAFVEYRAEAGAISARESMNNTKLGSSQIKVTYQRQ